MGFWQALSALAPVAPAMSDAQDIRTQRTQDAAKFAQDQALSQAQLTVRQLAAQGDTQKNQDAQTIRSQLGVPLRSYTDASGSQHTVYFTKDGQTKDVQDTPSAGERLQSYISTLKQNGVKVTPEQEAAIAPGFFGQHTTVGASAKPVTLKGPDGQPMGASFTNGRYFDANGDEVANPILWEKPAPPARTPTNDTRFIAITGRPQSTWTPEESEFVNGYKNMIDVKTTQPGVARMNALAQNRIVTPIDPNDSSAEIYTTAGQAMKQGLNAPGSVDYKMQMPTGAERARADLAMSAREQMSDMEDILRKRADLFGPASGKVTNVEQWLGSQDPDAQRFQAAARVTADHLAGVFGGRSQAALQAIHDLVGKNTTNPAAAIAGLEQLDKAAARIQSRGVAPNVAGGGGSPAGTVTLHAGGKIYHIPRDKVAEFKKDNPDAHQ